MKQRLSLILSIKKKKKFKTQKIYLSSFAILPKHAQTHKLKNNKKSLRIIKKIYIYIILGIIIIIGI